MTQKNEDRQNRICATCKWSRDRGSRMLDCVKNAPVPVQVEDGHCFPEVRPE